VRDSTCPNCNPSRFIYVGGMEVTSVGHLLLRVQKNSQLLGESPSIKDTRPWIVSAAAAAYSIVRSMSGKSYQPLFRHLIDLILVDHPRDR